MQDEWGLSQPVQSRITAVLRKLIAMANVLIRDGRKWNEYPA